MRALVITDVQNDFLPGGGLAVAEGDAVIPVVNRIQPGFDLVVATQDWHPANHGSFAANHPGKQLYDQVELGGIPQVLWPVHCVQNSRGAELAGTLHKDRIVRIFQKGIDPQIDSYSTFFDNRHRRSTGLGEWLQSQGVTDVCLCGLATDYCVKFSALDALKLGFQVCVVDDACRAVNLQPGDGAAALAEMKHAGATILSSGSLG